LEFGCSDFIGELLSFRSERFTALSKKKGRISVKKIMVNVSSGTQLVDIQELGYQPSGGDADKQKFIGVGVFFH
jgi:hypothetical protein